LIGGKHLGKTNAREKNNGLLNLAEIFFKLVFDRGIIKGSLICKCFFLNFKVAIDVDETLIEGIYLVLDRTFARL